MVARSKTVFDEINITPLTDIFLVLLIIMMVVAPMMNQMQQNIQTPQLVSGQPVDPSKLTVEVTKEGQFFVQGKEMAESGLTGAFKEALPHLEEKNVVIRADKATRSGVVIKIFQAARDAGYEKVTVAGEPLPHSRQQELEEGTL